MGRFREEDYAKDFINLIKQRKPAFMSIAAKLQRVMDDQNNRLQVRNRTIEIDKVINKLKHYKAKVDKWKEENYTVIGYARKSASPAVTSESRVKSLQTMIEILHARSYADMVFVSPSSNSATTIAARDFRVNTDIISCLKDHHGDTQDMIKFIRRQGKKPVVLVCLTYAGFTTNVEDLKDFLHYHKNIKYLVVDNCGRAGGFDVLSCQEILENPHVAERFNCRTSVGQRSK
ncbi:hypothetical protein G6F57_016119 [Rhizopus arrhizus]|nr:hypothetical protein G6F21_013059 [Rhizopus arrhizus]KAG1413718.1 hypothetical protein G6F58_007324 [Rhizopus delemar]KAG0782252.1 hypothetical protein G6F22_009194 [Rhizopus arrhizus]KAG0803954.1 hypothetical protein G6F20_013080 [Rhizopus arrhizus]KAG0814258.1 hypothetical protein G6F19_013137 [Rhizopus arrhizus]